MAKNKVTLKARLILYHRGKILLLRQTKPNGGNYTLVGGKVEKGEFAMECLIRETREEAGIQLNAKDLQLVHLLHKITGKKHRIVMYFKAYRWKGELEAREREKFRAAEWFPLDKLPKNLTETVKHVLREYRDGHFYSEMEQ